MTTPTCSRYVFKSKIVEVVKTFSDRGAAGKFLTDFPTQTPACHFRVARIGLFVFCTLSIGRLAIAADLDGSQRQSRLVDVVRQTRPAVVPIYPLTESGQIAGSGTGTIIHPDGFLLTNHHVVSQPGGVALVANKPVRYKVVGRLPEKDLAVCKLQRTVGSLATIELGDSNDVMAGESIAVLGNPGGRGIVVTSGIVSSENVIVSMPNALIGTQFPNSRRDGYIQFDAASNRGNSGGPVINMDNELIGIVSLLIVEEQNTSFAIPINRVKDRFDQMMEPELIHRRSVGLSLNPHSSPPIVTGVTIGSAAEQAGVQVGDAILSANQIEIRDALDWTLFLSGALSSSAPMSLTVTRGDQSLSVSIRPATISSRAAFSGENLQPGLKYDFYDGDFKEVPPFDSVEPQRSGIVDQINLERLMDGQQDRFAIRLSGYVSLPKDALYRFVLTSDDGSWLKLDNQPLIDNDGNHPSVDASRLIRLAAGPHPIEIGYFEGSGQQSLQLTVLEVNADDWSETEVEISLQH